MRLGVERGISVSLTVGTVNSDLVDSPALGSQILTPRNGGGVLDVDGRVGVQKSRRVEVSEDLFLA